MEKTPTLLRKLSLLLLSLFFCLVPEMARACDTSGYGIDNLIDNGDGTFTIQMTVMVAGGLSTGVGSTWGFYWNVDVPILGVSPPSLTSSNGTTLNAVINGMTIEWGDPNPSANTPFVDMNANGPDESFQVTVVVQGLPTMWDGGGMEGNNCPGGNGTDSNDYMGEFPCLELIYNELPAPPSCPGDPVTIGVVIVNNYLPGTEVVWQPGNLMGEMVTVFPTETTTYTATLTNYCDEQTVTVTVDVTPFPTVEAVEEEVEGCIGFPVVLEVTPQNAFPVVVWEPGGPGATFLVDIPDSYPATYTAFVSNQCGEDSVDITVIALPSPEISFPTSPLTICAGETITLQPDTVAIESFAWVPTGDDDYTIDVSPNQTTTYTVFGISECGIDSANVTVEVAGTAADTLNLVACEGESVMYNGIPLSAPSSSTFTYETFDGCDSVVTVVVEELPTFSSNVTLQACEGETVNYNGTDLDPGDTQDFTFAAANGCDSVVTVTVTELPTFASTLSLPTCAGDSVSYDGTWLFLGDMQDFTFAAANGCDSVVTVTVPQLPTYATQRTLQTCTGTTVTYAGTTLSPGDVMDFTLTAANGCDSVVTVTVEELSIFTQNLNFEACTGTTVTYAGTDLDPGTTMDFNFTTANGCDSVVTVTVTEVTSILDTLNFTACSGETVPFNGQDLDAGTSTDFPFTTPQGCDSVVTVIVAELPTFASPLQLSACTGETATYAGTPLDPSTVTDFVLPAANGCDSVVTVTVVELLPSTGTLTLTACANETVNFGGQTLQPGSVTDFNFTNWLGCDSTLTVTVEELPAYASSLALQACTGSTVVYNGVPLPPNTTIPFTLTAANGCDSIVSVTVTEVETIFESVNLATCPGSTVVFDGTPLGPNTVTDFSYQSYLGCDSVVTVTVDELDVITASLELEACDNSTVPFNGQQLLPGSVTDFNFTTANGCDSILTVTVVELPTYATPLSFDACTGTTVDYGGTPLAPGSVTDFVLPAANGCDSVVTVTVVEIFPASSAVNLQACTGTTADFNGTPLQPGSVTDFNFLTWQGCDSIVTVTVEELLLQASSLELEACEGTSVSYAGQQLPAGSVTDVTLTAANGCDSVVTVTVLLLDAVTGSETLQGCAGETLTYQGVEIAPGTSMDFTLVSTTGCDSIVTVTALQPLPVPETFENYDICEGSSVLVFGQLVSAPGTYTQSFTGANGCDSIHTVTVNLSPGLLLLLPETIEINFGDELVLDPAVDPLADLTFDWSPEPTLSCLDCQNPVATPVETTTYALTISDPAGCTAVDAVQVIVRKKFDVYIPNSFSPNGDGLNDVFLIFSDNKSVLRVQSFRVFSRWGEPVFEIFNTPTNLSEYGWDGSFRGEEMDAAVFAYFAEVEFIDGSVKLFKGDVTLVR